MGAYSVGGRALGVGLFASLLAIGGCAEKKHPQIVTGVVTVGEKTDFPAGSANTDFVIKYGIVIVNDSGTILAIQTRKADGKDVVVWNPKKFQFEATDGSRYDLLGSVVKGPAVKSLPGEKASVGPDGTVTVDLDAVFSK